MIHAVHDYPAIIRGEPLYREGTCWHEKEIYRFDIAYKALGLPVGKKILDIGSYPGTAAFVFATQNHYTAFGLLPPDYVDAMSKAGIPYINGSIESYAERSDADVILFTEIIEHLRKPYLAMKNLKAIAKPGALIYLTTNNSSYYGYILKLLCNRDILQSIASEDSEHPGHMRYFGLDELAGELALLGFTILSKRYINFLPAIRYYRNPLFATVKNAIGAIVPSRYATNIEIIARR